MEYWRRVCLVASSLVAAAVQDSSDTAAAAAAAPPRTTDSSTQTSQPRLAACARGQVTLRRGDRDGRRPHRPRPWSMVDYQSYRHTQQLVRNILEQPATQGLAPEVQELVESIRLVLQSDQEHMEEAVRSASYIEQVGTSGCRDEKRWIEQMHEFTCILTVKWNYLIFLPIDGSYVSVYIIIVKMSLGQNWPLTSYSHRILGSG